jgi:3-dehydroquinate synthase
VFTILSDGYPVHIGDNALQKLKDYIQQNTYSQYFILVDENTLQFCLSDVIQNVEILKDAEVIETESGEENKVIEVVTQVWLAMSDLHADRKALVINLGGGVLGDMGGFIASTYKRGVDFINIPTTLLSMVDSSVGGKLGIDLGGLKNQIGVFNFPKGVFIAPQFLSTLEHRQLKSGFAEVLKHALIKDANYWNEVKNIDLQDFDDWTKIIHHSVEIKNQVVLKDPKEKGERKILNFGHTIGHAIETYHLENFKDFYLHGEAIAIGMVVEAILSVEKTNLKEEQLNDIFTYFNRIFKLPKLDKKLFKEYLKLMIHDKKNSEGKLSFSLLSKIGECTWDVFCNGKEIEKAFNQYNKMIK